ncbi:hypothetical protein GCM10023143_26630 [Compostibacter hankyongensis]|uniref:Tetratricopeptide repeat protein n=2 Tax=Compostibacter hankyongensis TaxID=1007089 RepID=A0ABP8G1C1_9BACT
MRPALRIVVSCMILCGFLLTTPLHAQPRPSVELRGGIDSLEAEVIHQDRDTARVNELLHLSFHYLYNDTLRSRYYARSAVNLAGALHYHLGQIVGFTRMGDIYAQGDNFRAAYAQYMRADEIGRRYADRRGLFILYNALGGFHSSLQEFDQALEYFQRGLLVVPEGDTIGKANLYLNIGVAYGWAGDYAKAREYLNRALTLCTEANARPKLAFIYSNMGNVFAAEKEPGPALAYFEKARELARTYKNNALLGSNYLYVAEIYMEQGKLREAMQQVQAALKLAVGAGATDDRIRGRILMSRILARMGEFEESGDILRKLDQDQPLSIEQQKFKLEAAMELYREKGDYRKALDYAGRLAAVKDSITRLANRQNMDLLEVRFRTRQREAQIGLLQEQNKRKTTLVYAGGIGLLLCILIIFLLFHSRKLKEKVYRHRQKMLQDENDKMLAEKALMEEKALRAREDLDHKNRELSASIMQTDHMTKLLLELRQRLSDKQGQENPRQMEGIQRLIRHNLELNEDWQRFKLHFEAVHPDFFDKLMKLSPQLSKNELKHCAYIRMNMSNKQVANLLNVNPDSVKMSRYRIKKKLSLLPQDDLIAYILTL